MPTKRCLAVVLAAVASVPARAGLEEHTWIFEADRVDDFHFLVSGVVEAPQFDEGGTRTLRLVAVTADFSVEACYRLFNPGPETEHIIMSVERVHDLSDPLREIWGPPYGGQGSGGSLPPGVWDRCFGASGEVRAGFGGDRKAPYMGDGVVELVYRFGGEFTPTLPLNVSLEYLDCECPFEVAFGVAYCYRGPCDADVNLDGRVDIDDLLAVLSDWQPICVPPCRGDVNCDVHVDFDDLLIVLDSWGPCDG